MYKRKGTSMATNKTLYHRHFLLLWLLPILAASAACFAEVYKWVDDTGKIHFSDKKPEDAQAETLDIRVNSYSFPKIETNLLHSRSAPASSPTASRNIIMYSTARCGYCKKARAFFRKNNICVTGWMKVKRSLWPASIQKLLFFCKCILYFIK